MAQAQGSIAFIGGGNMAKAIVSGLIGRTYAKENIYIIDPIQACLDSWQDQGVNTALAASEQLKNCDVWVLAVKPQQMAQAIAQSALFLNHNTLVISIAAGLTVKGLLGFIQQQVPSFKNLVRTMPNTPALIAQGVTGLYANEGLSVQHKQLSESILGAVGSYVWVDQEEKLDAITALSGSGPAYVFLFIENLIKGGVQLGLSAEQAKQLAIQTVLGSASLAQQSADSPSVLREKVTSKGGTTAAALAVFNDRELGQVIIDAMSAASNRAAELAKELS